MNLYLFDWDWTLARPASGQTFRKPGEKYVWLAGGGLHSSRLELLEHLYVSEHCRIAVATNQGGIAYGIIRQDETEESIHRLLSELSFPVHLLVCPYHPAKAPLYEEYAPWRKPEGEMFIKLHGLYPGVKPEDVTVIGDLPEDAGAAQAAGFAYVEADEFFLNLQHDLETFISAEQNAGEVFEEEPVTSADRGEDIPF